MNFKLTHCHIQGGDTNFDTFAEVMTVASQVGTNVLINFGGGNTLTLVGLNITRLEAADFDFNIVLSEIPNADKTSHVEDLNLALHPQDLIALFLSKPEALETPQEDADIAVFDIDGEALDMG